MIWLPKQLKIKIIQKNMFVLWNLEAENDFHQETRWEILNWWTICKQLIVPSGSGPCNCPDAPQISMDWNANMFETLWCHHSAPQWCSLKVSHFSVSLFIEKKFNESLSPKCVNNLFDSTKFDES